MISLSSCFLGPCHQIEGSRRASIEREQVEIDMAEKTTPGVDEPQPSTSAIVASPVTPIISPPAIDSQEHQYMRSSLCLWVKSCFAIEGLHSPRTNQPESLTYLALCNGVILNNVMLYIDPRPTRLDVCHYVRDIGTRLKNLSILLKNLRSFYDEVLHQIIVMPLPDLLTIARQPYPDESSPEMSKILLLLLGCAVQSDKKEEFINRIKELDVSLQHAIVEQIQKVTNDGDVVLSIQALEIDPDDAATNSVLEQLQRVVKERDGYIQTIVDMAVEHDGSESGSSQSGSNGELCGHKLPEALQHDIQMDSVEQRHVGVELADCKAKLRRMRQELEEKLELLAEYKDELGDKDNMLAKLRQENLELLKDARLVKTYRDELDILREKAAKVDRLEMENDRFREKLSELEFYKSRVDEIRSENNMLLETRNLLEDQLNSAQRIADQHSAAEGQLLLAQKTVQELLEELKSERNLVSELMEQNSKLEQEHRSALSKSSSLERQLACINDNASDSGMPSTLSDQLSDSVNSRLLKLELENEQLRSKLRSSDFNSSKGSPESNNNSVALISSSQSPQSKTPSADVSSATSPLVSAPSDAETTSRIADLSAEVERLNRELDLSQRTSKRGSTMCLDLQQSLDSILADKQAMETQLKSVELEFQAEVERLERVNGELTTEVDRLRSERETAIVDSHSGAGSEGTYDSPSSDMNYIDMDARIRTLSQELDDARNERDESLKRFADLQIEASRSSDEIQSLTTRLMELEKEKLNSEKRLYEEDRNNRWLEKENLKLKQLLEVADSDFEKHLSRIAELERDNSRRDGAQKCADEANAKAAELEIEKRHLTAQLEFETKNLSVLREDLISEKSRFSCVQSQLQGIAGWLGIPAESLLSDVARIERLILDAVQRIKAELKADIDAANFRLIALEKERDALSADVERQRRAAADVNRSLAETSQQTENYNASDAQTAQRLRDMETKNTGLCDENRHVKEQVRILQEQTRRLQMEASSHQAEANAVRQELNEIRSQEKRQSSLSSENAKLSVELRQHQLKADLIETDNAELQKQLLILEKDHQSLRQNFEQMQKMNAELSSDHEMLQNLHTQLNRDYERVCNEVTETKTALKQLRLDYHAQVERSDVLQREHGETVRLKTRLEAEKNASDRDYRQLANLQSEHGALKRAHDDLKARFDMTRNELDALRAERRMLKEEVNGSALRQTRVQGHLAESQERRRDLELYLKEIEHRCEMLQQLNATLKEESRTLMRQSEVLLQQNQELFNQALMDKDHFHAEEKELQEKLNNVRRQKEKLEEKIMDQYKMMESPHKGKKHSSSLMKRAKAFISRTEARKASISSASGRQSLSIGAGAPGSGNESQDNLSVHSSDEGGFNASSGKSNISGTTANNNTTANKSFTLPVGSCAPSTMTSVSRCESGRLDRTQSVSPQSGSVDGGDSVRSSIASSGSKRESLEIMSVTSISGVPCSIAQPTSRQPDVVPSITPASHVGLRAIDRFIDNDDVTDSGSSTPRATFAAPFPSPHPKAMHSSSSSSHSPSAGLANRNRSFTSGCAPPLLESHSSSSHTATSKHVTMRAPKPYTARRSAGGAFVQPSASGRPSGYVSDIAPDAASYGTGSRLTLYDNVPDSQDDSAISSPSSSISSSIIKQGNELTPESLPVTDSSQCSTPPPKPPPPKGGISAFLRGERYRWSFDVRPSRKMNPGSRRRPSLTPAHEDTFESAEC